MSLPSDQPASHPSSVAPGDPPAEAPSQSWLLTGCALAVTCVGLAAGLRWLLHDTIGTVAEFITFYPAVAVVAMLAGRGPGLLATALCAAVGSVWVITSNDLAEVLAVGLFVAAGILVSQTAGRLRQARAASEQANSRCRDEMDRRVLLDEAVRESEQRLQLFIEHAPVALAMFDRQMRYLVVSRRLLADFLPGHGDIIGRNHYDVFPECPERWRAAHRRALAGEIVQVDEDSWTTEGGRTIWQRYEVRPWYAADGSIGGIVLFIEDITQKKRMESELRAEKEYADSIIETLHEPLLILHPNLTVKSVNPAFYTHFQLNPAETVGRKVYQLGNGQWDIPALHVLLQDVLPTNHVFNDYEVTHEFEKIGRRVMLVNGRRLEDMQLILLGIRDITERKKAEEELRLSEERLRAAVELVPLVLAQNDRELKYSWIYDPHKDYASEAVLGKRDDELSDVPAFRKLVGLKRSVLERGKGAREDIVLPLSNGVRTYEVTCEPLRDSAGSVIGVTTAGLDITERKQAEEILKQFNARLEREVALRTGEIREREQRLQAIFDSAFSAIITINGAGIMQSVNKAAEDMFGYTASEMLGHNVNLLMPSPYHEEHDGYIRNYLATGEARIIGSSRELLARRKDGTLLDVSLAVAQVDHQPLFVGIIHDVTRRKQLEREVLEIASFEQRRIGQDLHDSVAQELTALNLLAADLYPVVQADPAAARRLQLVTEGLQRCQVELRAVLRGLLPVSIDREGLMSALADLAERTEKENGIRCVFDCVRPVILADNVVATHLFLIAQEAVRNAVKHSGCNQVIIKLTSDGAIVLVVTDDGEWQPTDPLNFMGLGTRIMRNRAAIIDAVMTISPNKPTGTEIRCAFPRRNHDT